MTIPPEVTTAIITIVPIAVGALIAWLKLKTIELQGKLRDKRMADTDKKVDAIHEKVVMQDAAPAAAEDPSLKVTTPSVKT